MADDPLRFKTPAVCTTKGGSTVEIGPGRYVPEAGWVELDDKWKTMENTITRIEAENKSLKSDDSSVVGWKTATATLIVGILAGRYAWSK